MTLEDIREFIASYPLIFLPLALVLGYLLYRLTKAVLARGSFWIAFRTETVYDDLMVDALVPFRFAWLLPLVLAYYLADYVYEDLPLVKNIILFLIIWVTVDFTISVLSGINEIYEHRPRYTGVSVAGYIGLFKVFAALVGAVLSISLFADVPPAVLLGGIGAWLAVLLLIFRDTILNFLASIQISTQELVKDGDWIEVPSYEANGIVSDISLNSIRVQNFDNTTTVIPTYKIVDVAYKNWRGIEESGGRRIRLSIHFDVHSVKFCDMAMLENLKKYDLIADTVSSQIEHIKESQLDAAKPFDFPLDGPQITNFQLFMRYSHAFLRSRKDLHQRRLKPAVVVSEPSSQGMSMGIFTFTKKTGWAEYAATQDEIILHLVAAAPYFDLVLFQESTDLEFIASTRS